ncbi:hypothetical protein ACJJI3_11175 [Microbulbifer sp. ZKSA004]|uniref:hypothetical protein n=1 Tax=Microbulbifer sp. ZKSA004 TaxID=3243389 RepID=UPI00403A77E8
MYQESHSLLRKVIFDCAFLALNSVLLLSGSLIIFNGDTAGKPPEVIKLLLSSVCFLGAALMLFGLICQIRRISNLQGGWYIELNSQSIRFETPDDEVDPFDLDFTKVNKLSREAYEDDGIWYKWFIYTENDDKELKRPFDLGPFSEEKIADKINRRYGIRVVEVNINGHSSEWQYTLWFRLKSLLSSIFGALIFSSFVIPGLFYLLKVIQ